MKIAAVVVVYNPTTEVVENIKSYYKYVDNLYIIDNSNTDNRSIFCFDKTKFLYCSLKENMGIAKALNVGIGKAILDGCDWCLTMDQDSKFYNNIIYEYKKYLNKYDTSNIMILAPRYITDRNIRTNNNASKTKYLNKVMQSANLLNLDIYRKIGKFNEELFIDCVDYDYCFRGRKRGYKIVECPKAVLIHSPAITKTINLYRCNIKYGYASPIRYYYQSRNITYLLYQYKKISMLFLLLYKLFKIIFLFSNKGIFLKYFFLGINDSLHRRFGRKEVDEE